MNKLVDLIKTIPGGFLGALGLIGLFKGSLELQKDILYLVDTYTKITNPIIETIFGPIFNFIGLDLLQPIKTYLSIGVIVALSLARMIYHDKKTQEFKELSTTRKITVIIQILLSCIIIWPLVVIMNILIFLASKLPKDIHGLNKIELAEVNTCLKHFIGMTLFLVAILFLNYGLLFAGVK